MINFRAFQPLSDKNFVFLLFIISVSLSLNSEKIFASGKSSLKPAQAKISADVQKPSAPKIKEYSFRPLLIHGKKDLSKKIKEMKVETGTIVESQLFFVNKNFKKRIFIDEGIKE